VSSGGGAIRPPALGFATRVAVYLRSLSLQASWNTQRMQNLGLLASLLPWLRRQGRSLERDRLFCRRYYEFFNTNPYLANFVIGGLLRLEADQAAGADLPRHTTRMYRDTLARALASLGDQLFWLGLKPTLLMAACLLALHGRADLVLSLTVLCALAQLWWRWHALGRGYALGFDVVEVLGHPGWHRGVAWAKRAATLLTGATGGWYLVRLEDAQLGTPNVPLLVVAAVGFVLPGLLRRRWPGEALVLVAAGLAFILTFAIPLDWS
jgi:PTS system mannose-specific IID component